MEVAAARRGAGAGEHRWADRFMEGNRPATVAAVEPSSHRVGCWQHRRWIGGGEAGAVVAAADDGVGG